MTQKARLLGTAFAADAAWPRRPRWRRNPFASARSIRYSGPVALYGDEVARGYQLAIDKANAKGGVIGRKIEIVARRRGNPQQGIAAVEKLVGDKVDIFVGTYISAVSNAASDAAHALQQALLGHERARRRPDRARPAELRPQRALCRRASPRSSANAARDLSRPRLGKEIKGLKVWIEQRGFDLRHLDRQGPEEVLEKEGATRSSASARITSAPSTSDRLRPAREGRGKPDVLDQDRLRAGRQPAAAHMPRPGLQAGRDPARRHR